MAHATSYRNRRSLLALGVIAALSVLGASSSAFAQGYEMRFPYLGLVASDGVTNPPEDPDTGGSGGVTEPPVDPDPVIPVTLSLASSALPYAMVGQPYSFDFGALLTIEGDNPPALSSIYWPAVTGLPPGLTLTDTGVLTGTPTTKNETGASFEVVAQHADAEGRQVFTIIVNGVALNATQISVSEAHSCAITSSGGVKCWGSGADGRLGNGGTASSSTPVDVVGLSSGIASISAGRYHTCAITTGGALRCWGDNSHGQLGDGTQTDRSAPVTVSGMDAGVASVSGGSTFTCAVTTSGAAKCWGLNVEGYLGDGSTTRRLTPVTVSGLGSGVANVSAGSGHVCAATTSGAARCWGANNFGELGDGTTTTRLTPVPVSGLASGVLRIETGDNHSCAVTTGGALQCWGRNTYGILGDGTTTTRSTPVAVAGLSSGVVSVTAGAAHTCVVTTSGAARCWGNNASGQIGTGATAYSSALVTVPGLSSGVTSISAGLGHTCATTTSGVAKCWGNNGGGRLGDGTTTARLSPVEVLP